jgi:hypothetical protein
VKEWWRCDGDVVRQKRAACSSMSRMMRLLLSIGELLPISFGISWDLKFVFALAKTRFGGLICVCVCVCLLYITYILILSSFLERKKNLAARLSREVLFSHAHENLDYSCLSLSFRTRIPILPKR